LRKETINFPLGCLQGGASAPFSNTSNTRPIRAELQMIFGSATAFEKIRQLCSSRPPRIRTNTTTLSRRWRTNPSETCSQGRLIRGSVTSKTRRTAHASGYARCGVGASSSAIQFPFFLRIGPSARPCGAGEREFCIYNLRVRIHLII